MFRSLIIILAIILFAGTCTSCTIDELVEDIKDEIEDNICYNDAGAPIECVDAIIYPAFDPTTSKANNGILKPKSAVSATIMVQVDGEEYYSNIADGYAFRMVHQYGDTARLLFMKQLGLQFDGVPSTAVIDDAFIVEVNIYTHQIDKVVFVNDLLVAGYNPIPGDAAYIITGFGAYNIITDYVDYVVSPSYSPDVRWGTTFYTPHFNHPILGKINKYAHPIQEGLWFEGEGTIDSVAKTIAIYINM